MSWIQNLIETYDACFGKTSLPGSKDLTPIDHIEQQAHIEIALNEDGTFRQAQVVEKEATLMPATEKSAGRTSGAVAHPLCDKLRYVAADYGAAEEHSLYVEQLRAWSAATNNAKLRAILRYVERGTVVDDLAAAGVLTRDPQGKLEREWRQGLSPLAKLLTADPKTKQRDQGNALIRWTVSVTGDLQTKVWEDVALQKAWADYVVALPQTSGLCLASGSVEPLAFSHPKRLRHGGDGAKLISANDNSGYTFRGRFGTADEAYGLGSHATQKAHNALRWLFRRQGTRTGDQVIVAWELHGAPTPRVAENTQELLEADDTWLTFGSPDSDDADLPDAQNPVPDDAETDDDGYRAGQQFALQLQKKIRGYKAKLGAHDDVVVMAMDSATPGRMGILYYRRLRGSEFLDRIERWHRDLAWPQDFGKERRFIGVPSPREIAEAAYGQRADEKLVKSTTERLLPCIVDAAPLPRDLVRAASIRAANRVGMEHWEFERTLGVACSLLRGSRTEEEYRMSLEEDRTSRSYLFGRLLAVAEKLESHALFLVKESRDTNAERLMQRFANHPSETWRTIDLALRPYMQRLRSSRPAALSTYRKLLDEINAKFQGDDFTRQGRLDPEFLLGYHCQRAALRRSKTTEESEPDAEETTAV